MKMFKGRAQRVHFVGIGGIGMSGIAEVLLNLGYPVSGSDLKESDTTRRLQQLGGQIALGHAAENVQNANVVVISSAVKRDNPEVVAARHRSVPVIPRAEMLGELMRLKHGIAVAGSHGKTTTTSLIAAILDEAKLDPTVVIGGKVNSMGSNARLGQGEYLVAEADESDGSFMKLSPTLAVVTNIDPEHLDHYGDLDRLKETFLDFVNKVPFYGLSALCLESPHLLSLLPRVEKRYVTYGTTSQADFTARDIHVEGDRVVFVPVRRGEPSAPIRLKMVGQHNVLNALAAVAIADALEIPYDVTRGALEAFEGVQRRFTIRGQVNDITVVDDYAHHPTEIKATLAGARSSFEGRILAIMQPHRYSRLSALIKDFATSFYDADAVFVLPVYAAGEQPQAGIDAAALAAAIRDHGHRDITLCESAEDALAKVAARAAPKDLVVTLGAGDVWRVGTDLLTKLAQ